MNVKSIANRLVAVVVFLFVKVSLEFVFSLKCDGQYLYVGGFY